MSVLVATLPKTYSTSFPATENPLSQSGIWTNGGVFDSGANKTNMQSAGKAYGTMVSFNGTDYVDSCACLKGYGANHQVTATISNSGGFSGFSLEVEILLRADITSAHIFTYETDCVFGSKSIALVRWDCTLASPNAFTVLRAGVANETPLNTGDQVRAKIVGTLVTVDYKPFGGAFSNLFSYDTAGDPTKYGTGNPGIGAWNETGLSADQPLLAWSDFAATEV